MDKINPNLLQKMITLQKALDMEISIEQKKVVLSNFSHPILVNAWAGSGKTILFMLTSLINIMMGYLTPNEIMGITFSKKAQQDMGNKYDKFATKVATYTKHRINGHPCFTTFHALFYRLLRLVPGNDNLNVLTDGNSIKLKLYPCIKDGSAEFSNDELLSEMFDFREFYHLI